MKKRVFSGVQPSGIVTIGNYLGAMKNFVGLQDDFDCFYSVVDLHTLTTPQEPQDLRERTVSLAALYLAMGIDPERSTLFLQSHVAAHSELAWLLQCVSYMGELGRMTQFKEKSEGQESVTVGLFTYPTLMAADILLYQTEVVPVGEDQKQHLELARDIATRFNHRYGEILKVPEPVIPRVGARIKSLDNPTKKMSKSDENPQSYISVLDDPNVIKKKVNRAVTDSEAEVRYDEDMKQGVSNLLTIHSLCSGDSIDALEERYRGQGYGALKRGVIDSLVAVLEPIQKRYHELITSGDIWDILEQGATRAESVAQITLSKVKAEMGLAPRRHS